jgi:hypothetical protein
LPALTNATKAAIIAAVNAALALVLAFGVPVTDLQTAAITGFANTILGLWVAFTYKNSPKRVPDFDA